MITPAQLVPMYIRRVFTRNHASGWTLDNNQVLRAVQEKEEVTKAATMRPGEGSVEARVEAMKSTSENYALQHPQSEAPNPSTKRTSPPDLAGHISPALVAGCPPAGFQHLVKGKLNYATKWREHAGMVIQIMMKTSKEWNRVELEVRDRAKEVEEPSRGILDRGSEDWRFLIRDFIMWGRETEEK